MALIKNQINITINKKTTSKIIETKQAPESPESFNSTEAHISDETCDVQWEEQEESSPINCMSSMDIISCKPKPQKTRQIIDYYFRIVFMGVAHVGKTSIFDVFRGDDFKSNTVSSSNIDFDTKIIEINKKSVKLEIFDTCGQEKYNSLTKGYARGAHGIIFVYDFNDLNTLNDGLHMYKELADHKNNPCVIMVANKHDLAKPISTREEVYKTEDGLLMRHIIKEASREYIVHEESLIKNANKIGAIPTMVSAKTGLNIKTIFKRLAELMIDKQHQMMNEEEERINDKSVKLEVEIKEKKSSGCCS
ncbi:MAG: hypothetical protein Edafosvirus2_91 [Edafosvirus sp.]|uniref:Uncharacterized protein n=1 Tax=Edafosvirus sp. TaxID=2487765 RepID=A0A3G4ZSL9_9VIRU|nr:MAG: hypothetical protein Edafosvirus2_91 [Edafosvirus sp.]